MREYGSPSIQTLHIMTIPLPTSGAFAIFFSILIGGAPLPADAADFRLRIPNPLPRISKKIEKVGGFFFRTARRLEGVGDDEYTRRVEPSRTFPNPTSNSQKDRMKTPVPSDDSRRRDDDQSIVEQSVNTRSSDSLKSPTPRLQTRSTPEAPVQPNDAGTAKMPAPSNNALAAAPSPDPRVVVKPQVSSSQTKTPSVAEGPEADGTTAAPSPEVEAKSRSKYLYGRLVPNRPGLVYPPDREQVAANLVDVRGIAPGTKVRDPATGAVFLVP